MTNSYMVISVHILKTHADVLRVIVWFFRKPFISAPRRTRSVCQNVSTGNTRCVYGHFRCQKQTVYETLDTRVQKPFRKMQRPFTILTRGLRHRGGSCYCTAPVRSLNAVIGIHGNRNVFRVCVGISHICWCAYTW